MSVKNFFWVPLIMAGMVVTTDRPAVAASTGRFTPTVARPKLSPTMSTKTRRTSSLTKPSRVVHTVQVDASANNGEYVGPEICEMNCFAATASFTTVPYFSLDQPRSVTIVYNGDQAFPRPYIYADVNANDGTGVGVRFFELSATLNGNPVTFVTGGTTFRQSGSLSPTRITAEMDGSALSTNVYPLVVTVKATYNDNGTAQTSRTASLLVVNESNSAIARGWTVAGVQHLYSAIGGKYIATSGDGSAIAFNGLNILALDFSKLTFDGASSTYTRTYKDGRRVIFNSVGQETSLIELDGRTYTFFYDAQGRLWSVRDPFRTQPDGTPASIGFAYDANGLHQIQEPGPDRWNWHGRNTFFVVDANRRLTSAQDPDGVSTGYGYDASGRLSTITDRRGSVTTLGYDATSWKLVSITLPQIPVDAGGGSTTLASPVINLTPYQSGSPGAIVDAARHITTFTVNKYGQALDITSPYNQHTTIVRSGILPIRITHPETGTDTLVYDSQGRVTKTHLAGQDSVKFTYTGSLLTTVTGPGSNSSITYHYNASNKVDTITRNGTPVQRTLLTYDNVTGLPATVADQMHHQATYLYDTNFGNVRSETAPGNRTVTRVFDGFGRDSIVTPPVGGAKVVVYDIMNRATSDSAFTRKLTFSYDQLFQTDVYDVNGNHYHTDFNALGWPTRQCDAFSLCSTTRYDPSGAVTSTTNRRNQIVSVTRDSLGRVTSRTGPGLNATNYSYQSNGHDMVAWNAIETDSIYHNPGDKVTSATDSVITLIGLKRYKVFHGFPRQIGGVDSLDIRSNTNTMFDPRVTGYAPDGLLWYFRLGNSSILFGHDADVTGGMTNYPVSGLSRTSTALSTHMTNSVGWTFGAGAKLNRNYHYDPDNRIDQIMVGSPVATQLVFGYDALGQLTTRESRSGCSLISSDSTSGYNYSCPTLLSSQTFAYDSMGNRRDMGGVPTTGNRYAAFNGASYTYDADGNLIHKNKVGVYDIYYYWNALNQLDSVVNNGYRTQFEYNAFDKPIRVKEGSSYPLQVQRYLLWDGENLLAQLDTAGQRGVDYGYLPGALDHPIAYEHGPTWPPAMAFVDVDEAGNVIGSVEAGSLRQDNSYDAWGAVTSNIPTDQSLYWKGLFWNGANTGLYYMRNRWYDPESGRFLSEDPAGFGGGDNLYAFAGNDPINGRDPSGLGECRWVVDSQITVSGAGPTVTTINGHTVCFPSPSYPGATNSNPIPAGPNPGPAYPGGSGPTRGNQPGPGPITPWRACMEGYPGGSIAATVFATSIGVSLKSPNDFRAGASVWGSVDRKFSWLPGADSKAGFAGRVAGKTAQRWKFLGRWGELNFIAGGLAAGYLIGASAVCYDQTHPASGR